MEDLNQRAIYKHYKGGHYIVIGVGTHVETGEQFVVFKPIENQKIIWIRPIKEFQAIVDVDGIPTKRFTYVRHAL
ncbi:DUF1653 domain-containing protein [Candidatus Woesearchaeota archaeon]|nr:DUF1653 domain-containing protein [Candidatus Woesearchaeota archaeon]MBW3022244.1 DUF1653 domain-containing protein [Candidatus Woesearchaeota archaeon]